MNQLQVIGTHNSYHRELSPAERAAHDAIYRGAPVYDAFLAYSHASLPNQLGRQGARGLELDLFPDPDGGLYAHPLLRKRLMLGPLGDPAWSRPGVKVLHTADLDYKSTCVQLVACLGLVRRWSRANPGHVPLLVMLELKGTDPLAAAAGGVAVPPWDGAALDALDAEIRSVFSRERADHPRQRPAPRPHPGGVGAAPGMAQPAPVPRPRGLPHGQRPGAISAAYTAGRPSLQGRVLFTNSQPGRPDAAFVKRNQPTGENTAQIRRLVRQGYLVRTRSDEPLGTVTSGDTAQLRAALASGAHLVSTDFPEVGMSARYDSDFVVALPEGGPARCNPVNAPPRCRTRRLERSDAARAFAAAGGPDPRALIVRRVY